MLEFGPVGVGGEGFEHAANRQPQVADTGLPVHPRRVTGDAIEVGHGFLRLVQIIPFGASENQNGREGKEREEQVSGFRCRGTGEKGRIINSKW